MPNRKRIIELSTVAGKVTDYDGRPMPIGTDCGMITIAGFRFPLDILDGEILPLLATAAGQASLWEDSGGDDGA